MSIASAERPEAAPSAKKSSPLLGLLPFIGVILFVVHAATILLGDRPADWQMNLLESAVANMIGVAGIGAGISHLFFSEAIARSIGWTSNQFQKEIGFANLAFGTVGIISVTYGVDAMFMAIVASSVFRVGCGVGHIRDIVQRHNYALNNTTILFLNFVVPAFLLWAHASWS